MVHAPGHLAGWFPLPWQNVYAIQAKPWQCVCTNLWLKNRATLPRHVASMLTRRDRPDGSVSRTAWVGVGGSWGAGSGQEAICEGFRGCGGGAATSGHHHAATA